jgi:hypothetical protein
MTDRAGPGTIHRGLCALGLPLLKDKASSHQNQKTEQDEQNGFPRHGS